MITTIHQIEHAPHLSLFEKFRKADVIVLGDIFQYKKNYFENRNKIKQNSAEGWQWITVPVEKDNHKPINEVSIIQDGKWQKKYLETIKQQYSKTPYFDRYYSVIYQIICEEHNQTIGELNLSLMTWLLECCHVGGQIRLTSQLNLTPGLKSTDLLVEICQKTNATTYISGPSGRDYLELEKFHGINVDFHESHPGLSIYDTLFNFGGI